MSTLFTRLLQTFIMSIAAAAALAQSGDEAIEEPAIEVAGGDVAGLDGDGGYDLEDIDIAGNPFSRIFTNWPEDLVVAPVPGRSPQIGWNLALVGGYFLDSKETEDDKPSMLGGFGMYAENGSYAYGGGANLHLLDDKLRVKAGAGYMDIRYRFYGIGNDSDNDLGFGVELLQEAPMYFVSASWDVWNHLYVGVGYLAGDVDTRFRIVPPETPLFDPTLSVDIAAWTLPIQFDTRDHEQFPRDGWLATAKTQLYRESAGGDFDADIYKLIVNRYLPMRDRDVLALRAMTRFTGGKAPFFLLSTFGGTTDLRGYPSGRYRDKMMYAVQGEYRWQVNESWVLTGFAGVGEVADSFSRFGRNFLPAAGVGARFVISKKHRVSLALDIAAGNDGTEYYFGVGEAF